jgi:serine/threonine-protein kinase
MAIRFRCPYCNQLCSIGTRKAGCNVNCPKCHALITVPVPHSHSAGTSQKRSTLPVAVQKRINDICDRFESDWRAGKQPHIQDFVPSGWSLDERGVLLIELLRLEHHYRPAGQGIRPEHHLELFPDLADCVRAFFRLEKTGPFEGLVVQGVPPAPALAGPPSTGRETIPQAVLGGRYRLEQLLGEGGMGQVYFGRDTVLARPVAVKLIRPRSPDLRYRSLHDGRLRQAFEEEARIGAGLTHPAIATVFDFGFHEGEPFTVFEFIGGETLGSTLRRRGRLPLEDARLILGALAQGLDFAHSRHVVHRDLKPENIRATAQGHYKILDLGLARQFRESADWNFAGTPEYASPEQAAGLPCDGRTDQYALAVVGYEILTGRRPFKAPPGDRLRVLQMHRYDPPPPPSELAPDLPEAVNAGLLRALEKEPNRRFSSCQEFALALGCRLLVEEVPAPEILRLTPAGLGFSSGQGHLALTADTLWFASEAGLTGWRLCDLAGVRRPGGLWKPLAFLEIEIRGVSGPERHKFSFRSYKRRREWQKVLEGLTQEEAASGPSTPPPIDRPAVLIDRDPGIRYQSLGVVEYQDRKRRMARAGLQVRAALIGADAVIRIEEERLPELNRTVHRARGTAVRAVDADGRRELLGRWFTDAMGRFSLLLFPFLALFLFNYIVLPQTITVPAVRPSLRQAAASALLILSWPFALAALLRWLRWPQLVRATSLTFLGLAIVVSPPFVLLAQLLALAITGNWPGAAWTALLLDPTGWLVSLVLAYAALRAWRMHREYRRLAGPGSGPEPTGRRLTETGTLVVSALFCLTWLVLGVRGPIQDARAAVMLGDRDVGLLRFKAGALYYTNAVTENDAQKLGEFLVNERFFDDQPKEVILTKSGDTFAVHFRVKPEFQLDTDYHRLIGITGAEISRKVFDKAPVVVHLCDEKFKTLKQIEAHRYVALPEGTLHYAPSVDRADAEKLAAFLVKEKFFDGSPKLVHLDQVGATYELRFPVVTGADTDPALVPVFKQKRVEVSQALGNKPVNLRLCNAQLQTIKLVTAE